MYANSSSRMQSWHVWSLGAAQQPNTAAQGSTTAHQMIARVRQRCSPRNYLRHGHSLQLVIQQILQDGNLACLPTDANLSAACIVQRLLALRAESS